MKKEKEGFLKGNIFYILIIATFIITIAVCAVFTGCSLVDNYFVKKGEYDALNEKLITATSENNEQAKIIHNMQNEKKTIEEDNAKAKSEIDKLNAEINELKTRLDDESIKNLEEQVEQLKLQPGNLKKLINNMNDLLANVYIGSAAPEELAYTFTAFTILYNGKTYIITAGHCVADNYGKEGTFKFKANFSQDWIYPDLLGYKAEYYNLDDYGVFYMEGISGGFEVSDKKTEDQFLLGSIEKGLSIARNLGDSSKRGESGSPVINENGQVVGIYVVYGLEFTPIQFALDVIDNAVID
jgi:flagellar motility protein MotE (MotC chaperone)